MQILITGGLGYAGIEITKYLQQFNYKIIIVDNLLHKNNIREIKKFKNVNIFKLDINKKKNLEKVFKKNRIDCVLHLAAIVGDPASKKNPKLTIKTNLESSKFLFRLCKKNNLKKFIFFSTCSNYGLSKKSKLLNEKDKLNPLSLYAKTKVEFEKYLIKDNSNISKIILRISTLYGFSSRMRFDLTINEFTKYILLNKNIEVYDQNTWRPYLHLNDLSKFVYFFVRKNFKKKLMIFNTGKKGENYTKKRICEIIIKILKKNKSLINYSKNESLDRRDYKINFNKISKLRVKTNYNIKRGIKEMVYKIKKNKNYLIFKKMYTNS